MASTNSGRGTAAQAFGRRTGINVAHGLVHLGLPRIDEANKDTDYEADVDALGDALTDAGYRHAVIAMVTVSSCCAPAQSDERTDSVAQPAASGRRDDDLEWQLPAGKVEQGPPRRRRRVCVELRLDRDRVLDEFDTVWDDKSVVLVKASNLVRSTAYLDSVSSDRRDAVLARHCTRRRAGGRPARHVDPARDGSWSIDPAALPQ